MKVELVAHTKGYNKYYGMTSEEIVSAIARHGVIKEDGGKLVKYLMDNKHWSPLDMINFVFEITTSRAIGRQIIRHSSINVQEHSQRYSSKVSFEKIELRKEDPVNRQSSTELYNEYEKLKFINEWTQHAFIGLPSDLIESHLQSTLNLYNALIEAGIAKECARMILPECTSTTITLNGTLRSWLSFLNVRMEEHAQKEIREIAKEIGRILSKEMPNVFSTIEWEQGLFM